MGDVLIVGGGLAGLFCALELAPRRVTILSAAPLGDGASSAWAQGGVAAAVAEGDTPEAHARDTVAAGAGLVDEAVALEMAREAPRAISWPMACRSTATFKAGSPSRARPPIRPAGSCMCRATAPAAPSWTRWSRPCAARRASA
jgi:glycine/D-amino acid oxidase-like deaminating enzyme